MISKKDIKYKFIYLPFLCKHQHQRCSKFLSTSYVGHQYTLDISKQYAQQDYQLQRQHVFSETTWPIDQGMTKFVPMPILGKNFRTLWSSGII